VIGFDTPTADASEHGNEPPSCIKDMGYIDKLSDRQLLKKNSPSGISSLMDTEISCVSIITLTFATYRLMYYSFYPLLHGGQKANLGPS
jgi:hypothetical protein